MTILFFNKQKSLTQQEEKEEFITRTTTIQNNIDHEFLSLSPSSLDKNEQQQRPLQLEHDEKQEQGEEQEMVTPLFGPSTQKPRCLNSSSHKQKDEKNIFSSNSAFNVTPAKSFYHLSVNDKILAASLTKALYTSIADYFIYLIDEYLNIDNNSQSSSSTIPKTIDGNEDKNQSETRYYQVLEAVRELISLQTPLLEYILNTTITLPDNQVTLTRNNKNNSNKKQCSSSTTSTTCNNSSSNTIFTSSTFKETHQEDIRDFVCKALGTVDEDIVKILTSGKTATTITPNTTTTSPISLSSLSTSETIDTDHNNPIIMTRALSPLRKFDSAIDLVQVKYFAPRLRDEPDTFTSQDNHHIVVDLTETDLNDLPVFHSHQGDMKNSNQTDNKVPEEGEESLTTMETITETIQEENDQVSQPKSSSSKKKKNKKKNKKRSSTSSVSTTTAEDVELKTFNISKEEPKETNKKIPTMAPSSSSLLLQEKTIPLMNFSPASTYWQTDSMLFKGLKGESSSFNLMSSLGDSSGLSHLRSMIDSQTSSTGFFSLPSTNSNINIDWTTEKKNKFDFLDDMIIVNNKQSKQVKAKKSKKSANKKKSNGNGANNTVSTKNNTDNKLSTQEDSASSVDKSASKFMDTTRRSKMSEPEENEDFVDLEAQLHINDDIISANEVNSEEEKEAVKIEEKHEFTDVPEIKRMEPQVSSESSGKQIEILTSKSSSSFTKPILQVSIQKKSSKERVTETKIIQKSNTDNTKTLSLSDSIAQSPLDQSDVVLPSTADSECTLVEYIDDHQSSVEEKKLETDVFAAEKSSQEQQEEQIVLVNEEKHDYLQQRNHDMSIEPVSYTEITIPQFGSYPFPPVQILPHHPSNSNFHTQPPVMLPPFPFATPHPMMYGYPHPYPTMTYAHSPAQHYTSTIPPPYHDEHEQQHLHYSPEESMVSQENLGSTSENRDDETVDNNDGLPVEEFFGETLNLSTYRKLEFQEKTLLKWNEQRFSNALASTEHLSSTSERWTVLKL